MKIYPTRYQARKAKMSYEITVKVDGGYTNMDRYQYYIWKNQK